MTNPPLLVSTKSSIQRKAKYQRGKAVVTGPAMLGWPTSERLKVITLNCAVRTSDESSKLLDKKSHNMGEHDSTSPPPVAQTPKSGCISSKEELIKYYPHHF